MRFRHIPELDGFRGLAISFVVVGRYFEFNGSNSGARAFAQHFAQLGVLLFFVLSGFLITALLHRELSFTGTIDFKRFYVRRVLRLAPAFVLFLSIVVVLIKLRLITDVTKLELLLCFLYLRNIFGHSLSLGHIWSLSLEEQFYLVWPISFYLIPRQKVIQIVSVICLLFMLWRGLAISLHLFSYESGTYYVRPYFRFDSFLIGGLAALCLFASEKFSIRIQRIAKMRWALPLWLLLFFWAAVGERFSHALHITISEILVTVLLVHIVIRNRSLASRICRLRIFRYLGAISYSLYLWQELFISKAPPSWGPFKDIPLAFVVPVAIAMASYHLMERPILGLKNRLAPEARSEELRTEAVG